MPLSDWLQAISPLIGRGPPVNQTLTLEPSSAASTLSPGIAAKSRRESEAANNNGTDNIFLDKMSETQYLGGGR